MKEPHVISVTNDDGTHSHYALINPENGEKLWSENPEECKAQGYPVKSRSVSDEEIEREADRHGEYFDGDPHAIAPQSFTEGAKWMRDLLLKGGEGQ